MIIKKSIFMCVCLMSALPKIAQADGASSWEKAGACLAKGCQLVGSVRDGGVNIVQGMFARMLHPIANFDKKSLLMIPVIGCCMLAYTRDAWCSVKTILSEWCTYRRLCHKPAIKLYTLLDDSLTPSMLAKAYGKYELLDAWWAYYEDRRISAKLLDALLRVQGHTVTVGEHGFTVS